MSYKPRNLFTVEWWVIEKRQIYLLLCALLVAAGVVWAGTYIARRGIPFLEATNQRPGTGARFSFFQGDVRIMRGDTRETVQVTTQTEVFAGDTVQTQSDGRARIALADGSLLVVRENSTVVIRDNMAEAGQKPNVKVAVDRGQINVRTEELSPGARNVVETPKTENELGAKTNTSFGVNPDQTEEIRVSEGRVDSTNREGAKAAVTAGEYVALQQNGAVARREKLLQPPKLLSPGDFTNIPGGPDGTARVAAHWERYSGAAHYRLEVATSPFFVTNSLAFERDQINASEQEVTNLRPGTYFWRVRATAVSNQTSEWSEPNKFIVTPANRAQTAPSQSKVVVTDLAASSLGGSLYLVTGRAQPGASIRCLGRETLVTRDGTWQLQVTVPRGTRTLSVEAREAQGRASIYQVSL